MRKLICLVMGGILLSMLVVGPAFAEMETIKVGKGSLKVGGVLQTGFTFNMEDEDVMKLSNSFTLNRVRFLFWGDIVPGKIKYFVQTEGKNGTGVLDYKARFFYVPKTEITAGRFLPNFTYYMPQSTGKLELINYPFTTSQYGMWRQTGVMSTTKTEYVDFNIGIFNGADILNNIADNNDAKDFLVRADFKLPCEMAKVRVGGYAWMGSSVPTAADTLGVVGPMLNPDEETFSDKMFGGFAVADYKMDNDMTFKFRGEFTMGTSEYTTDGTFDNIDETSSQAMFVQASVQPMPKWEFLARFETYDPNTDGDDDTVTAITGGVNYYLSGINSMFYLNFIHLGEETDDIDNDRVQLQAQILF